MVNFVLLAHERSGSTVLGLSLAAHRNILMFGELFHNDESERRASFRADNPDNPADREGARFYRDGEDGATFLSEGVFCKRHWSVWRSVGFKLFYHHARRNRAAKTAWQYLLTNEDLRVIHLVRRNLLESYQSLQLATKTNDWARFKKEDVGAVREVKPFSLSPSSCESYFDRMTIYQQWVKRSFHYHPMIEIEYERDVCSRFQATMHDLHDFLDVPRKRARQFLAKQAHRKPSEQIKNYAALKEYFRYTPYEDFFTSD